ncbi:MAG: SIS domain-containing protein [Marinosulfonomonas sp.]
MSAQNPGQLMASESAEAIEVFCKTAVQDVAQAVEGLNMAGATAIYTIARGSSDAAANVLSYEFMRELGVPATSLPPSVFSIGPGVKLDDSAVLMISQSGASDDLVRSAQGASRKGARVLAITNQPNSPVEAAADLTVPIGAGEELAVPATKTVIGAIAAGISLISALVPDYAQRAIASADALKDVTTEHPNTKKLVSGLLRAHHVYVIGRDTGFGAAHEVALKLKECCALHAEAYSASEVLHGPLQLATNPLTVVILDTELATAKDSLDQAEARFRATGSDVYRISPNDVGVSGLTSAAAAALLLALMYPVILKTALALGHDPDAPATLSKVTKTV